MQSKVNYFVKMLNVMIKHALVCLQDTVQISIE